MTKQPPIAGFVRGGIIQGGGSNPRYVVQQMEGSDWLAGGIYLSLARFL